MRAAVDRERVGIRSLPLEVIQVILSTSHDLQSLISTALSCSALYHAFKEAEHLITSSVFHNELPDDVLCEALIALASNKLQDHGSTAANAAFSQRYLQKRRSCDMQWPGWEAAIKLSQMHRKVQYFATSYVESALDTSGVTVTPFRAEMARFERALYRLDIFRNMFGAHWSFHSCVEMDNKPQMLFFHRFGGWENEQMACIQDYLFKQIRPILSDIVQHDVVWGEARVQHSLTAGAPQANHVVLLGLHTLHHLLTTRSLEQRSQILHSLCPPHLSRRVNLHHGLETAFRYQSVYYESSKPFYDIDENDPPSATDLDNENAFRHFPGAPDLHMNLWAASRRLGPNSRIPTLREWAYALWNPTRSSQIFKHLTQNPSSSTSSTCVAIVKRKPSQNCEAEAEYSHERRRLIYLAGGRGWWCEEDESRVVWTKEQTPLDGPEKRAECPYCIGNVFCTPHRLKLVVPLDSGG